MSLANRLQALARAVYSRLSLIVLDDVWSAVDARTENLLIERLFGNTGLLRSSNSTVILATHASKSNSALSAES